MTTVVPTEPVLRVHNALARSCSEHTVYANVTDTLEMFARESIKLALATLDYVLI